MSNKRLFFALWPDDRQRDRLRDVISPLSRLVEGKAIDRRNWHVTLAFIGDLEENRIPGLIHGAALIPFEPFEMRFSRLEYWPRGTVASLVPSRVPDELDKLVASLKALLRDEEIEFKERVYRPHITVARRARPFEPQRLAQPHTIEWQGFELVESIPKPGGVSYRPLKQ